MTEQTLLPELDWYEQHNDSATGMTITRAQLVPWLWLTVTRNDHDSPYILRTPIVAAYLLSSTELSAAQREAELATKRQLEHAISML